LLELGTGFHPEFTGRENVYMNGALRGLNRKEMARRLPEIEAFSGIGEFVDQPVKTYSSGMFVRLAFATAIHVEPDILIIDEALAVGDEAFQRKCYSCIQSMQKKGCTVLFVSHHASVVIELCSRAILLDQGELLLSGEPKFVVDKYHKLIYAPLEKVELLRHEIRGLRQQTTVPLKDMEPMIASESKPDNQEKKPDHDAYYDPSMVPQSTLSYESHGAQILDPHITTLEGEKVSFLSSRNEYYYTYNVAFSKTAYSVRFGMLVKTTSGFELGGVVSSDMDHAIACVEAGTALLVKFRFHCILNPGVYFMNAGVVGIVDGHETYLHRLIDAVMFRVIANKNIPAVGVVDFCISPVISIECCPEDSKSAFKRDDSLKSAPQGEDCAERS
jgi:lipopolysaccharide transport system ATP-binding protein